MPRWDAIFVRFGEMEDRCRVFPVVVLEIAGLEHDFELFELVERLRNLRRFGYACAVEEKALRDWPAVGRDRDGIKMRTF